jgi:hypothetical protein
MKIWVAAVADHSALVKILLGICCLFNIVFVINLLFVGAVTIVLLRYAFCSVNGVPLVKSRYTCIRDLDDGFLQYCNHIQ